MPRAALDVTTVIAAIVAIFVGTFYLSAGEIRRVGQELFLMRYPNATATLVVSTVLVEAATVLNIPLSNTQALSGGSFRNRHILQIQVRLGQAVSANSGKLGNCAFAKLYDRVNFGFHLMTVASRLLAELHSFRFCDGYTLGDQIVPASFWVGGLFWVDFVGLGFESGCRVVLLKIVNKGRMVKILKKGYGMRASVKNNLAIDCRLSLI